jgi:hypothetical protein
MLRLFRITDAFNVNKRQLAARLSTTISALGVWERQRSLVVARPRCVTASPCDRAAVWGIGANPASRTYLLMAQAVVLAAAVVVAA